MTLIIFARAWFYSKTKDIKYMTPAADNGTVKLSKAFNGPIVQASTTVPVIAPASERISVLTIEVEIMPVCSEINIARKAPKVEKISITSEPSRLFDELG
jgi:hypothetical protein